MWCFRVVFCGTGLSFRYIHTLIRLGGVTVTHETDATDQHIYRDRWWRETHSYLSVPLCTHAHSHLITEHNENNVSSHDLRPLDPRRLSTTDRGQEKGSSGAQKGKRRGRTSVLPWGSTVLVIITSLVWWLRDCSPFVFSFPDHETVHGETQARSHQRQPGPLEEPRPASHRQRCKRLFFSHPMHLMQ